MTLHDLRHLVMISPFEIQMFRLFVTKRNLVKGYEKTNWKEVGANMRDYSFYLYTYVYFQVERTTQLKH